MKQKVQMVTLSAQEMFHGNFIQTQVVPVITVIVFSCFAGIAASMII